MSTNITFVQHLVSETTTTHHNRFTELFPGPPGWAGTRRELLDFMVQRKINRCRHTGHPAGRYSIRTNQCPTSTIPPSVLWHCRLGSSKGIWPV